MIKKILAALLLFPTFAYAQINTDRVMMIARNALYFEDYVLSIQYFNQGQASQPINFPGKYTGVGSHAILQGNLAK